MKRRNIIFWLLVTLTFVSISAAQELAPSDAEKFAARQTELQNVKDEMKAAGIADPGKDPNGLNALGYKTLYEDKDPKKAITYFQWNISLFPQYANQLIDSLAEGYLQAGEIEKAIASFSQAAQGDSKNTRARPIAEKLKADKNSLAGLQQEARTEYLRAVEAAKKKQ